MSHEPENLTPVDLRRIDANVQDLRTDMTDVKRRLTRVEGELGGLIHRHDNDVEERAHLQAQMDRLREQIDRIARRLDLSD